MRSPASFRTRDHAAVSDGVRTRDSQPENVMLIQTEDGERVKVLDFGIAKWAQKNSGQSGNIKTRTGVMIGTPTYMAPEQCGGEGEVCDRTDVYALGVMIFELRAGLTSRRGDPRLGRWGTAEERAIRRFPGARSLRGINRASCPPHPAPIRLTPPQGGAA